MELAFGDVGFCGGRKTRELGEKAWEQGENQQQTQPTLVGGESSQHCAIPIRSLHLKCVRSFIIQLHSAEYKYRLRASSMSPVTGLARLPGRILWCVHMGNFSPVDRDEFKKHNQNGGT